MTPAVPPPETAGAGRDAAREYEELVHSLEDVVFRFDHRGRWTYLSPAWEKRLGWTIPEALGRAAAKFVHRDDRGQVLRSWNAVLSGDAQVYRHEVRFREASGRDRWMLVSARGLRDDDGVLRGVTGTLTDVSAAKAVEAELQAARAVAEAANKAKSEFLSTMSHELRTPLNAVIGLTESLLEAGAPFDPERTRRYLTVIHDSGRQLLAQINDILDLARIEAGRIQINPEPFDARILCSGTIETLRHAILAKQIRVESACPAEPVIVHADERLLRQVLQNLVANAVKFTARGGRVTLNLERHAAGGLALAVSDTGIGIAPGKLPLLFKPFSQIDSSLSRQFGGTGLGLALVERIMKLHGGSVGVRSAPGLGSTFTVQLPASALPAPAAPPAPARSRRVVVVDDDPNQHLLVGDFLRRRGFDVVHCDTARSALATIPSVQPVLAIVDVNLPGMNGLELIAELRRLPDGRDLRILAATALAEADEAERCRAAGADAHLPKPISLAALAERIARLTGLAL
ncbi:MAG TPA: ATP-binding protein [Opitutaceae bacterium]|nr:ATP-binding protein [Opitutaceae bacterium]